jgi:hypothetical protein
MRRAIASSSSTMRGARPSDGSSSISRRGALIMARATATICCSPPLMVPASCCGALAQLGEVLEGLLQAPLALGLGHQPATEFEVFGTVICGKELPAFGHQHQAALHDLVRLFIRRSSPSSKTAALAGNQAVQWP